MLNSHEMEMILHLLKTSENIKKHQNILTVTSTTEIFSLMVIKMHRERNEYDLKEESYFSVGE